MSISSVDNSHRKLVKTRIIATVGPACEDAEVLRDLITQGVDIFRLNFAHGSHEWLGGILARIREVSAELKTPVGVLGDLSGPKIRLGEIPGGEVMCVEGETMTFVRERRSDDPKELTCTYEQLIDDVDPGDRQMVGDHLGVALGMVEVADHLRADVELCLGGDEVTEKPAHRV